MTKRSFIDQLHLDITNYIESIECKPTNRIYPNMKGAVFTKPYWNVHFPSAVTSRTWLRVVRQTLLLQIDIGVDKETGISDLNDYVSAINKAFSKGKRIGVASVAAPPNRATLGGADGTFRVALTISLNYFITPHTD